MANTKLADAAPGTILKIKISGAVIHFVVLQHGYPAADSGYTLLWQKSIWQNSQYGSNHNYANSTIDTLLTQTYFPAIDEPLRSMIPTVSIPYIPNGDNTSGSEMNKVLYLDRKVFILSATELGLKKQGDGTAIAYFDANNKRVVQLNGVDSRYHTRTPKNINSKAFVEMVENNGLLISGIADTTISAGIVPALCLPSESLYIDKGGNFTTESGLGNSMFIPASKLEQGVEYNFRVYPRNHQNQFQTGIDGSQLHMVVADGNEAVPDDSAPAEIIPSYTGNSQIFGDGYKGYIELYDSGVLTFNTDAIVDIFLVGGGGAGGNYVQETGDSYPEITGGAGGGGGYTKTIRNLSYTANEEIPVTIGAGGVSGAGGATHVGEHSANGGARGTTAYTNCTGGAGGSGGGAGGTYGGGNGGAGGSNGSNGGDSTYYGTNLGGTGQGTSTYEFMDTQLRLFAGGGGGGGGINNDSEDSSFDRYGSGGAGGSGGGGKGGNARYADAAAGTPNTGGGGGGAGSRGNPNQGAAGGSGIAIIRWGDWSTSDTGSSSGGAN